MKDHLVALTFLLDTLPTSARGSAQAALSSSKTAIDAIDGSGGSGGGAHNVGVPLAVPTSSPAPAKPDATGAPTKPSPSPNDIQPAKTPDQAKATDPPKNDSTVKDHPSPTPSPHATDFHAPGGHGALQRDRL